ncbi:hypothetical protein AAMO2058_000837700 [Amorphochlora amoebiformis]
MTCWRRRFYVKALCVRADVFIHEIVSNVCINKQMERLSVQHNIRHTPELTTLLSKYKSSFNSTSGSRQRIRDTATTILRRVFHGTLNFSDPNTGIYYLLGSSKPPESSSLHSGSRKRKKSNLNPQVLSKKGPLTAQLEALHSLVITARLLGEKKTLEAISKLSRTILEKADEFFFSSDDETDMAGLCVYVALLVDLLERPQALGMDREVLEGQMARACKELKEGVDYNTNRCPYIGKYQIVWAYAKVLAVNSSKTRDIRTALIKFCSLHQRNWRRELEHSDPDWLRKSGSSLICWSTRAFATLRALLVTNLLKKRSHTNPKPIPTQPSPEQDSSKPTRTSPEVSDLRSRSHSLEIPDLVSRSHSKFSALMASAWDSLSGLFVAPSKEKDLSCTSEGVGGGGKGRLERKKGWGGRWSLLKMELSETNVLNAISVDELVYAIESLLTTRLFVDPKPSEERALALVERALVVLEMHQREYGWGFGFWWSEVERSQSIYSCDLGARVAYAMCLVLTSSFSS